MSALNNKQLGDFSSSVSKLGDGRSFILIREGRKCNVSEDRSGQGWCDGLGRYGPEGRAEARLGHPWNKGLGRQDVMLGR